MLLVDGGSITYGDGLENTKDAWPYIVDKNVINISLKGKSPRRIEIDVQSYYYNVEKFNQCMIAWPNIIRNCLYKADSREYIDFSATQMFNSYQDKKFLNLYYTRYYCPVENLRTHWLRCLRLIAWFNQENIKWMMVNQDTIEQRIYNEDKSKFVWFENTNDDQIRQMFDQLKILEQEIVKKKNYKGFNSYFIADSHPTKEEHYRIASEIKEMWNNVYDSN